MNFLLKCRYMQTITGQQATLYVLVITCLRGVYSRYTENDIHNPEGVARGIMNII